MYFIEKNFWQSEIANLENSKFHQKKNLISVGKQPRSVKTPAWFMVVGTGGQGGVGGGGSSPNILPTKKI